MCYVSGASPSMRCHVRATRLAPRPACAAMCVPLAWCLALRAQSLCWSGGTTFGGTGCIFSGTALDASVLRWACGQRFWCHSSLGWCAEGVARA